LTDNSINPFLIEETAPEDSATGTTAYRFVDPRWIFYGPRKSIRVDENGAIVYVVADHYSGPLSKPQTGQELAESHITIVPGGLVADGLIKQGLTK
jgi:hypothetical protein